MARKPKIRWGTLLAVGVSVVGALGDPAVIGFLPHTVATAVTIAGAVVAGVKKAVVRDEHERNR